MQWQLVIYANVILCALQKDCKGHFDRIFPVNSDSGNRNTLPRQVLGNVGVSVKIVYFVSSAARRILTQE